MGRLYHNLGSGIHGATKTPRPGTSVALSTSQNRPLSVRIPLLVTLSPRKPFCSSCSLASIDATTVGLDAEISSLSKGSDCRSQRQGVASVHGSEQSHRSTFVVTGCSVDSSSGQPRQLRQAAVVYMSPGHVAVLFGLGAIHPPPVPSMQPLRLPIYQFLGSGPCDAPVTSLYCPTRKILSDTSTSVRCGTPGSRSVGQKFWPSCFVFSGKTTPASTANVTNQSVSWTIPL